MDLDPSFYARFAALCREVAAGLVALEADRAAGVIQNSAAQERMFRIAHDLAGQAGILERRHVCRVAALAAERLRDEPVVPPDAWPRLHDCVKRLLEAAARDATGDDVGTELDAISRELETLS